MVGHSTSRSVPIATPYSFAVVTTVLADKDWYHRNARLRGTSNKSPGPQKSPSPSSSGQLPVDGQLPTSQSSTSIAPKVPPLPNSPSLAQTIGMDENSGTIQSGDDIINSYHLPRPLPLWLNANCAKHIVKGNFMTLSARPKTVEQGEWIAHQGMHTYNGLVDWVYLFTSLSNFIFLASC